MLWMMMITMTKFDLSPSLPRSAHNDSAKLMEINFPCHPSVFPIRSALLECSSKAITCQCFFHSIASTWCVHQRDRLLPAPPIWSVPGPWTCVVLCMVLGPVCAIFFIHCVTDCQHHNQSFIQGQHCFLPGELWYRMLSSWRFGFFLQVWNPYKTIEEDGDEDRVVDGHDFQRWLSIEALIMPFDHLAFSTLACLPLILMLRCDGKMGVKLQLWFYNWRNMYIAIYQKLTNKYASLQQ